MHLLASSASRLGIALIALALSVTGCRKRETPVESGVRAQIFHIGNGSEPRDLDPHTASSVTESNILCALFEGLVINAPDGHSILPGAAERWEISPDGRVYTFHLRPGLKWSNGDPLTAEDFLYSFRRLDEPKLGAELAVYLDLVAGGQEYREGKTQDPASIGFGAPDPLTFVTRLKERTPAWLSLLAQNPFYPVHRATLEKHDAYVRRDGAWTRPGHTVGNGPFRLTQWRPNDVIVAERNPHWHGAASVRLNAIHFHTIDNIDAEERAYRGGLLHVTRYLPQGKLDNYRKEHAAIMRADPLTASKYVALNVTRAPFSDVRVRRAFVLAVDREAIVRDVMRDGSRVADSFTVPGSGIGAEYTSQTRLVRDPARARTLLAAAGFPGGQGFPPMKMQFTAAHQGEQSLVEALQAMWQRELGVRVELVALEEKVWLDTLRTKNFQMLMDSWTGVNDPVDLLQLLYSTSPNNDTGWVSAEYDAAFNAANKAGSDAERETHLQAMDRLLLDQFPIIPLYHQTQNYLVHPTVRGWQANILGWHLYEGIWLENP